VFTNPAKPICRRYPEYIHFSKFQTIRYVPGCLQIQPNQFAGDIQNTYIFKKFHTIFLRDKPYNIRMQVKFVMSINEQVMMRSDQRSSLCHPTRLLIYEQQT